MNECGIHAFKARQQKRGPTATTRLPHARPLKPATNANKLFNSYGNQTQNANREPARVCLSKIPAG